MTPDWHLQSIDDIFHALKTSRHGLSTADAKTRLLKYGPNRLTVTKGPSALLLFLRLFFLIVSSQSIFANLGFVDFSTFAGPSGVFVFDTDTDSLSSTATHPDWTPRVLAISPDQQFVYISWQDPATTDAFVSVYEIATGTFLGAIFLEAATSPEGLAITPDGSRVYIGLLSGTIVVVDTVSNSVLTTFVSPGAAAVYGVAITPDSHTGYVGLGSGNVGVIDLDINAFTTLIPTVGTLHYGLDVTPDGSFVYVADLNANQVYAISTATNTIVATIPVGSSPWGLAVTPDGQFVYVCNAGDDTISVIDVATNTVVTTFASEPGGPTFIAFTPDGLKALVTHQSSGIVATIDVTTNTIIATFQPPIGTFSYSVDITQEVPHATGLIDPSAEQVLLQSQELIYKSIEDNFEEVLYSGMKGIPDTYQDMRELYIIDNYTHWTNEVILTPFWCE